jgi:hypothetical protein
MKSNINNLSRTFSQLPKSWPARPNLINYDKADASIHQEDGWREVIRPTVQANQKLGELYYDQENDVVTYAVLDKTPEELEAERRAMVPFSITPTQGRIALKLMGLLDNVNTMIENSEDAALKIYWEYSLSWDRQNTYISSMANLLGMTEQDLDNFFIEASKIQ